MLFAQNQWVLTLVLGAMVVVDFSNISSAATVQKIELDIAVGYAPLCGDIWVIREFGDDVALDVCANYSAIENTRVTATLLYK